MNITKQIANEIFNILQENIGVSFGGSEEFAALINNCREYRISGNLGFGGKFRNSGGQWYVDCYPEHMNDERRAIIAKTNQQLQELRESVCRAQNDKSN